MNNGIVRSNNLIALQDFILDEWVVSYNSKNFLEVQLTFNTDLNKVFADYNDYYSTSGYGGLKVYIRKASDTLATPIQLTRSTSVGTNPSSNTSSTITVNDTIIQPLNNIYTMYFLSDTVLDVASSYTLIITLHEDIPLWERDFTLNISSPYNESSHDTTLIQSTVWDNGTNGNTLDLLDGTQGIALKGYYFQSDDQIKFTTNISNNGILSNTNPVRNNKALDMSTIGSNYGKVYRSDANFSFPTASYPYSADFTLVNTIKAVLIKTGDTFTTNYTKIKCGFSALVNSTMLSQINSTSGTYTCYIPVIRDLATDNLTISITDGSGNANKLSTNTGVNFNATPTGSFVASNGVVSFSINYAEVPMSSNGTAWGTIYITDANGLSLSNYVEYSVYMNQAPTSVSVSSSSSSGTAGQAFTLTGTATDVDDGIKQIDFYYSIGGSSYSLISSDLSSPYTAIWTPSSAGTYLIRATAIDNHTLSTNSTPITITIT